MATPGLRRILRVTVRNINFGFAETSIPAVKTSGNLFMYSTCHGHFHFNNFAKYILYDQDGIIIADGGKESYCLEDSGAVLEAPWVECNPYFDCGNQGVQRGWTDEYDASLDCQYLDITNVPPGNYRLEVLTNHARHIPEISFTNTYFAVDLALTNSDTSLTWSPSNDPVQGFTSSAPALAALLMNFVFVALMIHL